MSVQQLIITFWGVSSYSEGQLGVIIGKILKG